MRFKETLTSSDFGSHKDKIINRARKHLIKILVVKGFPVINSFKDVTPVSDYDFSLLSKKKKKKKVLFLFFFRGNHETVPYLG